MIEFNESTSLESTSMHSFLISELTISNPYTSTNFLTNTIKVFSSNDLMWTNVVVFFISFYSDTKHSIFILPTNQGLTSFWLSCPNLKLYSEPSREQESDYVETIVRLAPWVIRWPSVWSFSVHSPASAWSFAGHRMIIGSPFAGHSRAITWPFSVHSRAIAWSSGVHRMIIQRPFSVHRMIIQRPSHDCLKFIRGAIRRL